MTQRGRYLSTLLSIFSLCCLLPSCIMELRQGACAPRLVQPNRYFCFLRRFLRLGFFFSPPFIAAIACSSPMMIVTTNCATHFISSLSISSPPFYVFIIPFFGYNVKCFSLSFSCSALIFKALQVFYSMDKRICTGRTCTPNSIRATSCRAFHPRTCVHFSV